MGRLFLLILCILFFGNPDISSQPSTAVFEYVYPYGGGIGPDEYAKRRQKIREALPDSSALIIYSNDHFFPWIDDEYKVNYDLFYLTGLTDEKVKLILLHRDLVWEGDTYREVVFIDEQKEYDKVWNGVNITMKYAEDDLKINKVLYNTDYDDFSDTLFKSIKTLYIGYDNRAGNYLRNMEQKSSPLGLVHSLREKYPGIETVYTVPGIKSLRMIKSGAEIDLIQKAVDISIEAHRQTISNAIPGMKEYELRALMEYNFLKNGSQKPAYTSIVASGRNTCILHYTGISGTAREGSLVLMDCGAEYQGYASDITRTFPISGKFSEEQLAVYNVVLESLDSAISACRPGNTFNAPHNKAKLVLIKGLKKLGIIKSDSEIEDYFFHSANHYLGLYVHDTGDYGHLQKGIVLAVEPGVYIPEGSRCDKKWWNIGIRIEDNILITDEGPINLSGKLEKKPEEIEKLMKKDKNQVKYEE